MGGGEGKGGGKEGDWECSGCRNRNYAFRSFCNRCKQPRLLVDSSTPSDSKWLPCIGDWICTGCTNNNYASREKCKKCGQPKEIAAMPAIAIPGASLPTHTTYFARTPARVEQNIFDLGYSIQSTDPYGHQPASTWLPLGGNNASGVSYAVQSHQLPEGWRNGDWLCPCGFHNYSSRVQCKKCNAAMPLATASSVVNTTLTAVGTKRLASEDFSVNWDNKRLNAGQTNGLHQSFPGIESLHGSFSNQQNSLYAAIPGETLGMAPTMQVSLQVPRVTAPALLGKGAKQWREGDWMCANCNNHNYASRAQCNRCKTQREILAQPVSVA